MRDRSADVETLVRLPNPPLRYWPIAPSNDGIFQFDLAISLPDDEDLLSKRLDELWLLKHNVSAHLGQVVDWTEQCHAESECHHVPIGKEWIDFVRKVRQYLKNHVTKRNDEIEEAIAAITKHRMTLLHSRLMTHLEQLESEYDALETKHHRLLEAGTTLSSSSRIASDDANSSTSQGAQYES